ncbi:MAG TPA: amino acid adenylation domain-containing protein [Pyrinomonadaceae bacterium]|nr:amino acid adenylation domain-containing protein [Pyrinomonadaceae bacterium]
MQMIEGYQLSPQQRRLWLLQQESPAFCAQCAILIEGSLDHERLDHALRRIVRRHEILRTTFHRRPGIKIPIQVVTENNLPSLCQVSGDIEEVMGQERSLPHDFESGSLLRACVLRLATQTHVLIITLPALCADARTLKQLFHELTGAYLQVGNADAEATQYAQFAEWQNELAEMDESKAGAEFWRKWTRNELPELKLPLERPPRAESKFAPDSFTLAVEDETFARLALLARGWTTTIDVMLLACWQVLLMRLTGQLEFNIDCVFDGRKFEELEEACGLFASSLPIPVSMEKDASITAVVKRAAEASREAQAWQEYFTASVGEKTQNNLHVSFTFEERPSRCAGETTFSYYRQYCCVDPYKIRLTFFLQDDSLTTEFHFDTERFSSEYIRLIARSFHKLLESVTRDSQGKIAALEILDQAERTRLLTGFNQTAATFPDQKRIHELFEEQAARVPHRTALVCGDRHMTYAVLNARANQLAHFLQKRGVASGVVVGLCVERSVEMLVGLLGILKAGAAYVALDPEQPPARLAYQLQQSGAPLIFTQEHLRDRFPEGTTVLLDRDWSLIEKEPEFNPVCATPPEQLVYVIYTSGSTGVPKGVAITHRNLVNYATFICRKLRLDDFAESGGLHFATVSTLSADLGNTVIYPALISGGCLHILDHNVTTDGIQFAQYFEKHPIDVLKIVPSHLDALLSAPGDGPLALPRRYLLLGGEALSRELVERLTQQRNACQILNHYGPTETTVGSLTYTVGETESVSGATVPIGRPIANTQIYVLDDYFEPVPPGSTGELYIGGAGLAQGYLQQPVQTAERFLPDPFSKEAGARLYKTGDLVRYLLDGNVEFIGRVDQQVKLRGFRIELGEIEAALTSHASVRATVVVVRQDDSGNKHLVAYVVWQAQTMLSNTELRSFLKERLPDYMVPQTFVALKSLPLTPNGKIDRGALPKPEEVLTQQQPAWASPSTSAEKILAEIWQSVLGGEPVGIHDNFFERGGDSILSIQIITRANRAGLRLTPKQLFEHPTIAELVTVAGTQTLVETEQGLVTGDVPLTPIQQWFFSQELPEVHHWNMAVLLENQQRLSLAVLKKAFARLSLHHDALRMRFEKTQTGWRQYNADAVQSIAISSVDLSHLPKTEQDLRIEKVADELQASLNLSDGPLMRVALFELGTDRRQRLLIIVHHLVMDGMSWRILAEDLATTCEQLMREEEISLSPKTTSFKRWADLLMEHAQSAELRKELDFWLAQSRANASCLPVDFPDTSNTEASTRSVTVSLSSDETRALLHEVPEVYRTQIGDVLLTALMQAWARRTGSTTLLVDLEGHGREELAQDVDVSRTIGWFTTHYPVLLSLKHPAQLKESLLAIKEQLRKIPERGIGYGLLRYLANSNDATPLRAHSQPAVSFNYLGQFDQVLSEASLFAIANESIGALKSLKGKRSHPLRINGSIMNGRLQMAFAYSENMYRRHTIESLANEFINALRDLITHCQSGDAGGFSASDFPEAGLRQEDLDKVLARFSQTTRS